MLYDEFLSDKKKPYMYWSSKRNIFVYIIASTGPDKNLDINYKMLESYASKRDVEAIKKYLILNTDFHEGFNHHN